MKEYKADVRELLEGTSDSVAGLSFSKSELRKIRREYQLLGTDTADFLMDVLSRFDIRADQMESIIDENRENVSITASISEMMENPYIIFEQYVGYDSDDTIPFYKIDNGAYQQIPGMGTSFSIDVPLSTMTDNEHTVSVYAVDLNGVKGLESKRTFRISLEEPKGAVELPTIDTTVKGLVTLSGYASDKNGIEKVQISLDNGNSYNDAVGTEQWSYTVDSRAIPGGTQVVFLKITDKYGIQGLYSSLINIDNDAPSLSIELPLDDSSTTGQLFISGSNYDQVGVTELYVTIRNLERTSKSTRYDIEIDRIIGEVIDMSKLENGFYNVEVTAKDKAGNITNCSRNIHLDKDKPPVTVDILYPLNGEHKQGVFNIYGQSESEGEIDVLKLYIDGKVAGETTITTTGYFGFDLGPEDISEGTHKYYVETVLKNGVRVASREQTLTYSPIGPWVTIDNFTYGDFATERPYIRGQAGYSISEDELLYSKTKECTKELQKKTVCGGVMCGEACGVLFWYWDTREWVVLLHSQNRDSQIVSFDFS
jgi:hypothetical protein